MRKILICDHDDMNLQSCVRALGSYDVITVSNVKDALKAYADERPELVLWAYASVDWNDAQVVRAMNKIAVTKTVLMVTQELEYSVTDELYLHGIINHVMIKPVTAKQLHQLVAKLLDRCAICDGDVMGNAREMPCSYCAGTGRYTTQAYAFFVNHKCDCGQGQCDVCRAACHCLN